VVKAKAARLAKVVERMLLSVPPLDEIQALPWPADLSCGGRGLGRYRVMQANSVQQR
jgi:hypothetical protein